MSFEQSRTYLRTFGIEQHCYRPSGFFCRRAYSLQHFEMALMRAMREIESRNIHLLYELF
jgi:hypothetical protein